VVGVALFVVVLVLGAFSLRADDAPPPATDPQPATQDTKADQDSGADVEAEFVFKVVSTDGQPVAQASVKPWAVGAQSGSFLLPDSKFPSVKTDAEGMAVPQGRRRSCGSTSQEPAQKRYQ
jgi:hypothetical protein